MKDCLIENGNWVQYVGAALYVLFEAWLGKTSRVKPNSTLALIGSLLGATIRSLRTPKNDNQKGNV